MARPPRRGAEGGYVMDPQEQTKFFIEQLNGKDAEITSLRADLARVTEERDKAIAQSLASQAQATRTVLDATARAEAAERNIARLHAQLLDDGRATDGLMALLNEIGVDVSIFGVKHPTYESVVARAEAAEKRAVEVVAAIETRAVEAEMERDHWCAVAQDAERERAESDRRAELYRVDRDHHLAHAKHWRTVAESRPEISREDAAAFLGQHAHDPTRRASEIVFAALRAHAEKAVPR